MNLEFLTHAPFWIALGQIIVIDILLGGDNAVVIALACRRLPPHQRNKGILYGTAGAIGLRIVLIVFAMQLLALPYLKVIGALLLVWIGVQLLAPEEEGSTEVQGSEHLWGAVKTIILADLVMSVDNVLGVAGAAQTAHDDHHVLLVTLGLLISVPIIVWGSQMVLRLMERFPWVVTGGAMMLGWIAGLMLMGDPAIPQEWKEHHLWDIWSWSARLGGAFLVLGLGFGLSRLKNSRSVPE